MEKLLVFVMTFILLSSAIFTCNVQQDNKSHTDSNLKGTVQFFAAKPIWIKDREDEKNLTLGFRACINKPKSKKVILKIAASSIYRVYLNNQFIGHGPARAAHGFFRVDEWDLSKSMQNNLNIIAIEVVGYNVNSYYLLDQPAFLQAEIVADEQVLCATGENKLGFEAIIISERIQKVPRFSFQRPFIECYRLTPQTYQWRYDATIQLEKLRSRVVPTKKLLSRGVKYSDFRKRIPTKIHSRGKIITGIEIDKYWKDRSLTGIGKKLGGYSESELEMNPSIFH